MNKESVYSRNGKLISKSGDVRIYNLNDELFLEDGRMNLISSDCDKNDYIWQINDKPFGNCLIVGLGLATAVKYILSFPRVTGVTVLEENTDIIKAVNDINQITELVEVVNEEYLSFLYNCDNSYDFIFVDCYTSVNEKTIPYIADVTKACKTNLNTNGVLLGWLDMNTSEKFIEPFYGLFDLP